MNKRLINKNIDIVNELVIREDILYLSDVSNLPTLKEDKRLTEIISRDIATSMEIRSFLYIVKSIPGVSYVVKMFYCLKKIKENSRLKESKYMVEKGKVIAEIESVLRGNLNENDFIQGLNKTISESGYTQSQLANKAPIDYTYLNKILNRKLPPGSTVSRDIIIKIALAFGID